VIKITWKRDRGHSPSERVCITSQMEPYLPPSPLNRDQIDHLPAATGRELSPDMSNSLIYDADIMEINIMYIMLS
jgi:hypothetical protein